MSDWKFYTDKFDGVWAVRDDTVLVTTRIGRRGWRVSPYDGMPGCLIDTADVHEIPLPSWAEELDS